MQAIITNMKNSEKTFIPKVGFDGHGLNNYDDEYRSRIATFTTDYKAKGMDFGEEIAKRINIHNDLMLALERLLGCPDLNLDNLEVETISAMDEARKILDKAK